MALSKIDIENMITGEVNVANGGTGLSSGTSGQFLKFTGSTTVASAAAGGITVCDHWYLASSTDNGTNGIIADSSGSGAGGGAWTKHQSATGSVTTVTTGSGGGRFSFPTTGIYKVDFQPYFFDSSGDSRYCAAYIYTTPDNSTYTQRAEALSFIQITSSSYTYAVPRATLVFDVTNTTTHKVQFRVLNESALDLEAQTSRNATFVTFHRLGDT